MKSPLNSSQTVRAVLFDLDGTLYRQSRLRALMAMELASMMRLGPAQALRQWRALSDYRRAQEHLRWDAGRESIKVSQIELAAARADMPVADLECLVDEWMMRRPLKYLRRCRAAGIDALLDHLGCVGVRAGVLSDYPSQAKLEALGLAGRFSPVLCATDPDVGALKPSPRGFLRACGIWGLDPPEVLVVGDRPDTDAAGAAAAGMPCVIIGRGRADRSRRPGHIVLSSIERLHSVLSQGR